MASIRSSGLERAVVGMGVGRKALTVAPEEAYGAVDPDALAEVPGEIIPADAHSAG
jgi:FKBP-type peptidyl-prolyl cis-trans isomerase SlyD